MSYDAWKTTLPEDRGPIRRRVEQPERREVQTPRLGWCHACIYDPDGARMVPAVGTRAEGRYYIQRPLCKAHADAYDDEVERQGLARAEG